MPQKYRMGSKAYGRKPPEWWTKLASDTKLDPKYHKDDLPLAYAGEFQSKDGKNRLLVVGLNHAFTGDRASLFQTPGGQVYLVARWFSAENGQLKLLESKPVICNLEDLQYSRLFAGKAKGRQIEFRQEQGAEFDSRIVSRNRVTTLIVGNDNSLKFTTDAW
jgi:hypothetical protein